MKKIMFGNSLMLLGIAMMILAGLELIYVGMMWASFFFDTGGFYDGGYRIFGKRQLNSGRSPCGTLEQISLRSFGGGRFLIPEITPNANMEIRSNP